MRALARAWSVGAQIAAEIGFHGLPLDRAGVPRRRRRGLDLVHAVGNAIVLEAGAAAPGGAILVPVPLADGLVLVAAVLGREHARVRERIARRGREAEYGDGGEGENCGARPPHGETLMAISYPGLRRIVGGDPGGVARACAPDACPVCRQAAGTSAAASMNAAAT